MPDLTERHELPLPLGNENVTRANHRALVEKIDDEIPTDEEITAIARRMAGEMVMWPVAAAPEGWLLCEGQAVSRATYADLYALIGDTYGAGNGTTTFNLPNLKKRFPIGRDAATAAVDTLGETGGAFDHTHTQPTHTHTGPSHTHEADPTDYVGTVTPQSHTHDGGGTASSSVGGLASGNTFTTAASGTGVTGAGGGDPTGTNNPPFIVLNFIIKT